jgi:hypothetical protein
MAFVNLPPNLQDMFYSLSDRISKLETSPNQPGYDADAAQSTAVSAQGAASNAYSQAVLAETQATSALVQANIAYVQAVTSLKPSAYVISNASQQITSIATNGVTVYSGSSPSSGARVTMNSLGLAGYDSSGNATFSISASTGAANFAGSITGSTITGSTLNISGNFIVNSSGYLTATGATITGSITATSGSFTGSVYASSGTIAGWTLSGTQLYTSGSTYLDSSTGNIATIGNITAGGTISTAFTNISAGGSLTGFGLTIDGVSNLNGYLYNSGYATTTSSANAYINSSTGLLARSSSSLRYKVEVEPQTIPVQSILQLAPKSFFDKVQADEKGSTDGLPRILGLIAEEVAEIPVLADFLMNKNDKGEPDSVNYDRIAVALLPLLQDHEARLNKLEGK